MSVTFVTPNEMSYLHTIENLTKKRMTPLRPPTEKEAFKGQLGAALEEIESKMDENGLDRYLSAADDLLERYSAQDLAALLVKILAKDPTDLVPVKITPERPLPQGKKNFGNRGGNGGGNRRGNNNRRRDNRGGRGENRDNRYSRDGENGSRNRKPANSNREDGYKKSRRTKDSSKRSFVIRSNQD
jgi:ATP-dependent RNA helicase DeaD